MTISSDFKVHMYQNEVHTIHGLTSCANQIITFLPNIKMTKLNGKLYLLNWNNAVDMTVYPEFWQLKFGKSE